MNKRSFGMTGCICMCVTALAACSSGPATEITSTKPYADLIGAKYRTVDNVYAIGVYDSLPDRTVGWIILSPIKLGGRENVLLRTIAGPNHSHSEARHHLVLFDSGLLSSSQSRTRIFPRCSHQTGTISWKRGRRCGLNPAIYRKRAKNN